MITPGERGVHQEGRPALEMVQQMEKQRQDKIRPTIQKMAEQFLKLIETGEVASFAGDKQRLSHSEIEAILDSRGAVGANKTASPQLLEMMSKLEGLEDYQYPHDVDFLAETIVQELEKRDLVQQNREKEDTIPKLAQEIGRWMMSVLDIPANRSANKAFAENNFDNLISALLKIEPMTSDAALKLGTLANHVMELDLNADQKKRLLELAKESYRSQESYWESSP